MRKLQTFLMITVMVVLLSPTCYAYLDAGTGSIILQALIAGIVGSLFAIKIFWQKIKAFFKKIFKK
jgi:hypothetical protein